MKLEDKFLLGNLRRINGVTRIATIVMHKNEPAWRADTKNMILE